MTNRFTTPLLKISILVAFLISMCSCSALESFKSTDDRAKELTARMERMLRLDETQSTIIANINADYFYTLDSVKQADKARKAFDIQEKWKNEVSTLLDQHQEFLFESSLQTSL